MATFPICNAVDLDIDYHAKVYAKLWIAAAPENLKFMAKNYFSAVETA
jgi:hypothetical protein